MDTDLRKQFEDTLKKWYNTSLIKQETFKDSDFKYIVTFDTNSFCFDAKNGNTFIEPTWILEHCSTVDQESLWRMYFNTQDELFEWGCKHLEQRISNFLELN
jgi:hypothetical protein